MKATLEFQLPEDRDDYKLANEGSNLYIVLWEMDQYLRSQVKYAPDDTPEQRLQAFEDIREHLRCLMEERGLSFDMVS